jgi:hypothetical protein
VSPAVAVAVAQVRLLESALDIRKFHRPKVSPPTVTVSMLMFMQLVCRPVWASTTPPRVLGLTHAKTV